MPLIERASGFTGRRILTPRITTAGDIRVWNNYPPQSGLQYWWEGCKEIGLADGDIINPCHDFSGNGRDFGTYSPSGASFYPKYYVSLANGMPAVRFDVAYAQQAAKAAWLTGATSAQVFGVLKHVSDNQPGAGGIWSFGVANAMTWHPWPNDGVLYEGAFSTVRKTCGNPARALNQWHYWSVRSEANNWIATLDNYPFYSTTTNTFLGDGPYGNYYFGYSTIQTETVAMNGWFTALLIYSPSLTLAEEQQVWWYLSTKYGLKQWDGTSA